jgi:hypothetical protein
LKFSIYNKHAIMRFQLVKNIVRGYTNVARCNTKKIEKVQIKDNQEKIVKTIINIKNSGYKSFNNEYISNEEIEYLNKKSLEHSYKN